MTDFRGIELAIAANHREITINRCKRMIHSDAVAMFDRYSTFSAARNHGANFLVEKFAGTPHRTDYGDGDKPRITEIMKRAD